MLAHFIRAQLTLAALSGFAYSGFLGVMRVPNALMLGTVGGMFEFVPVVGPIVAAVVILGAAVLMSYRYWAWILVFFVVWRLVQDYVVSPRIMGKSMELHPLAAIFWGLGWRRDRWRARRLSFDSDHGKSENRLASLAPLRGKTQVRSSQRILLFPPNILHGNKDYNSHSSSIACTGNTVR